MSLLLTVPWSGYLEPNEITFAASNFSVRRIEKGKHLFYQGDKFDFWTGVISGLVRIGAASPGGKEVTFTTVSDGGWFGEGSLLKDEPRRYDVVAVRDTRLGILPKSAYLRLCEASLGFNQYLVANMNERIGHLLENIQSSSFLPANVRLARSICSFTEAAFALDNEPKIQISQSELGVLTGMTRQTANAGIADLQKRRLIACERDLLMVLDLRKLRVFCNYRGGLTAMGAWNAQAKAMRRTTGR